MKIAVEFPSVAFREGPAKVAELARAIEEIGYDELAVFDHVLALHGSTGSDPTVRRLGFGDHRTIAVTVSPG